MTRAPIGGRASDDLQVDHEAGRARRQAGRVGRVDFDAAAGGAAQPALGRVVVACGTRRSAMRSARGCRWPAPRGPADGVLAHQADVAVVDHRPHQRRGVGQHLGDAVALRQVHADQVAVRVERDTAAAARRAR